MRSSINIEHVPMASIFEVTAETRELLIENEKKNNQFTVYYKYIV